MLFVGALVFFLSVLFLISNSDESVVNSPKPSPMAE